jgi:hypothetical protein
VFLRNADGTDEWMWKAAMDGNLPLLQGLVAPGLDVNESKDRDDPADPNPFYQAEGPILQAPGNGHLEIVRWLLERGARINYEVHGRRRCLPSPGPRTTAIATCGTTCGRWGPARSGRPPRPTTRPPMTFSCGR